MKRPSTTSAPSFQVTPLYLVTAVLSWLVPGAGHWILGYRVRAVILGSTLLGTFWLGESVLANNMAVTRTVHPVFFGLQVGNGGSALIADLRWGKTDANPRQTSTIEKDLPRRLNLGILFCSVSGLLNLLLVLHVVDPRTWRQAAEEPGKEEAGESA